MTKLEYYKFLHSLESGLRSMLKSLNSDEDVLRTKYLTQIAQIELELDTIPEMLNFEDWSENKAKLIETLKSLG